MKSTKKLLPLVVLCIVVVFALASLVLIILTKDISTGREQSTPSENKAGTSPTSPYAVSSRFGKIPVRISSSENVDVASPTTLLNPGHVYYPVRSVAPELFRGKTVIVEGVHSVYENDSRVDWAWNGNKSISSRICFNKRLDIPDGTIIQAKVYIFPSPQEYCETGEVKEYKILYTAFSLVELSKKFLPLCGELTSFLAKENEEDPMKLYVCFGQVSPEGNFGEKFTHSYFEWLPLEGRMIIEFWAVGEKETPKNEYTFCKFERRGAVVLNVVSEKVEEIYMTEPEESCLIVD